MNPGRCRNTFRARSGYYPSKHRQCCPYSRPPQCLAGLCAVEAAILHGFAEVVLREHVRVVEVGDGTRDAQNLVVGPRAEPKPFERLLERREFRNEFIRILLRKQRYLAERILYLTSAQVEERFVAFLRRHYGEQESIGVNIPKRDIASSVGATPETFSRMLARLREEGLLRWEKGSLRIEPALWERWEAP